MRLHPDDIEAIACEVARLLRQPQEDTPPVMCLDSVQAVQRRSMELARQGRRAESIALQKTVSRMAQ